LLLLLQPPLCQPLLTRIVLLLEGCCAPLLLRCSDCCCASNGCCRCFCQVWCCCRVDPGEVCACYCCLHCCALQLVAALGIHQLAIAVVLHLANSTRSRLLLLSHYSNAWS
jgi:hypothetical protein